MACDRVFGNIERHLRCVPNLYTPEDYAYHIEQSVSRRYKVVRMKQAMFLNVGVLQNHITKRQAPGRTFKDARKLLFRLNYKEGFIIKSDYASDNIYTELRLMKGRASYSRDRFNLSVFHLPPLYNNPIPLTEENVRDLQSLFTLLPSDKRTFYQSIQAGRVEHNVTDVASCEEDDILDYCN
ncbi:hypothetical protein Pcinc_010672 [Petrolisthes cinctipes]|uniref:Uncharacterized protein n=1 Tax=Petrolisthes cinctipes TaxID=88211 RepID=A0AAE1G4W1_PETCI|nr:hypothetical protein Pcinc_010672 [Petrolisthes cinctipes]